MARCRCAICSSYIGYSRQHWRWCGVLLAIEKLVSLNVPPLPPPILWVPYSQDLRGEVMEMVSEHEEEELDGETYGRDERSSAECQRRLWGAEPARRDDVLPFFVWSIVHDQRRSKVALDALLDVREIS